MEEKSVDELIIRHGIKPTPNRVLVARELQECSRPVSLAELEQRVDSIDKSGIFRCLVLFRDHHLVHAIDDGGEGVKYELCHSEDCERDDDLHVHFHCERCGETFCLEDTPIPGVDLPEGFSRRSANYIIKGICPDCSRRGL